MAVWGLAVRGRDRVTTRATLLADQGIPLELDLGQSPCYLPQRIRLQGFKDLHSV